MSSPPSTGRFPPPPEEGLAPAVSPPMERAEPQPVVRFRVRRNVVLFLLTVASVSYVGIVLWGSLWQFAASLLLILVVHEFGHYLTARWHGVPASLPYFLPLPIFNPFGTLGAIILMPGRIRSRRALLDIGASGPLAGMAVAVPLMVYGLSLSELGPRSSENYTQEGQCLLYWALKVLVHGPIPADQDVYLHPIAVAAWAGLFITFLNLFPIGQLDGGHVAYALFGERQNRFARIVFFAPTALLLYNAWTFGAPLVERALGEGWGPAWSGGWMTMVSALMPWILLQALLLAAKRRGMLDHPPVDDLALSPGRKVVAVATLVLFVALFMPSPWVTF